MLLIQFAEKYYRLYTDTWGVILYPTGGAMMNVEDRKIEEYVELAKKYFYDGYT
jgi:hypothetical protein